MSPWVLLALAVALAAMVVFLARRRARSSTRTGRYRGTSLEEGRSVELFDAIKAGDLQGVRACIDRGFDPDQPDPDGNLPLLYAALLRNTEMLQLLLAKGADPDRRSASGFLPIHFASAQNQIDAIQFLLLHGASVDAPNPNGYTALYDAAAQGYLELTALLLARGAQMDARGGDGSTALHAAAHAGHAAIVDLLLHRGAEAFCTNHQGFTPLLAAAIAQHADVVRLLVNHRMSRPAIPETQETSGTSPEVLDLCLRAVASRREPEGPDPLAPAEALFRAALARDPGYWLAHFGLGEVLSVRVTNERITTGPVVEEVLLELRRACELAPGRREPHLKLAAQCAWSNPVAAEAIFRTAVDQCDNDKGCAYPLIHQAGDYWQVGVAAGQSTETARLALEAFCRSIVLDPGRCGGQVAPAAPFARSVWSSALLVRPGASAPGSSDPSPSATRLPQVDGGDEPMSRIARLHISSLTAYEAHRGGAGRGALEQALADEEAAWAIAGPTFPERYKVASHLALLLQARYDLDRNADDLRVSADLFGIAARSVPASDPRRADHFDNFGTALARLFEHDDDRTSLDESIQWITRAVEMTPRGSPSLARYLSNLGVRHLALYKLTSALADLRTAEAKLEEAVQAADAGNPDRPLALTHLAVALRHLSSRIGDPGLLDRAIELLQEAVNRTPEGPRHAEDLAIRLNDLGSSLSDRYVRRLARKDLERAVESLRRALGLAATPARRTNLGVALLRRHLSDPSAGSDSDLEESITLLEGAVAAALPSPDHPQALLGLGQALRRRHKRSGRRDDLERAVDCLKRAADLASTSAPGTSLAAAAAWLDSACERRSWSEAATAYEQAVRARESIIETQALRQDRASWLQETQGLAAKGAYTFYQQNALPRAVEALEQGLARLLNDALAREGASLEPLAASEHAPLVHAYRRQVASWQRAADRTDPRDPAEAEQLRRMREELRGSIARIRQIPGFEDFLILPDFARILAAVGERPIVYLFAAEEAGVGLIVRGKQAGRRQGAQDRGEVRAVALPDLTMRQVDRLLGAPGDRDRAGSYLGPYRRMLEALQHGRHDSIADALEAWKTALSETTAWLWSAVMSPLVGSFSSGAAVRLIPVGRLALLPLHAAWKPDASRPSGRRYALDELVISYAPNVSSLQAGARLAKRIADRDCLGIDEPEMDRPLQASRFEVAAVCSHFDRSTVLRRGEATVEDVVRELDRHDVAHFSCHGRAVLDDPLRSELSLAGGRPLTLERLVKIRLRGLRLVSLSACESGMSGTTLPDEFLNLPSGLIGANVAGVVSSLWSVPEQSTMLLMIRFYELWRREKMGGPAEALRGAQQWVRDSSAGEKRALIDGWAEVFRARGVDDDVAQRLDELFPRDGLDFSHPFYWAGFTHVGV